MTPFDSDIRPEIKERSNGKSELSGIENEPLMCAHLNHDKKSPDYCNPENGLRVTKFEECAYHQMHLTCPDKIGMEDSQNRSVVASYMRQFFNKEFSLEQVREKVGDAIELWEKFLLRKDYVY